MPLLNDLIETYDAVSGHEPPGMEKIAPVGHHYTSLGEFVIEVTVDEHGNLVVIRAEKQKGGSVLLAVTEKSASRTVSVKTTPHALNDNLIYMTPGYYLNDKGINSSYDAYINQLAGWVNSPESCLQIKAVYQYLRNHDLVDDALDAGLLKGADSDFDEKKYKQSLVLWKVMTPSHSEEETWRNQEVIKSWTAYYSRYHHEHCETVLDSVNGELSDVELLHPRAVSIYGTSKLMSVATKEDSTLHFKGERFNDSKQNMQIGYVSSQKIHNALGWLIDTQSIAISKNSLPYQRSEDKDKPKLIVCWSPEYKETMDMWQQMAILFGSQDKRKSQYRTYKDQLAQILYGISNPEIADQRISIFMTDCTGKGRFSTILYRSYHAKEFLKKLQDWYSNCVWYFWNAMDKKMEIASPSLFTIAKCAYGVEHINEAGIPYLDVNDAVFKNAVQNLLTVVLDDRRMQDSIIRKLVAQASMPERFSGNEGHKWWNWWEILLTACAVIHNRHMFINKEKGECDLELDKNNTDRSYLFGRLLAVLDRIENVALNQREKAKGEAGGDHRDTNAMRLWSAYAAHPNTCFANLRNCVEPYLRMLKYSSRKFYEDEIQEIYTKLDLSDPKLNRPLEPEYLMGYYLERADLKNYVSKEK